MKQFNNTKLNTFPKLQICPPLLLNCKAASFQGMRHHIRFYCTILCLKIQWYIKVKQRFQKKRYHVKKTTIRIQFTDVVNYNIVSVKCMLESTWLQLSLRLGDKYDNCSKQFIIMTS